MTDPLAQDSQQVQLALLDSLMIEMMGRLGTGESGESWRRVQGVAQSIEEALRDIQHARATGGPAAAGEAVLAFLRDLEATHLPILRDGAGEESARTELVDLALKRSRVVRVQQLGRKTVAVEILAALQAHFVSIMSKYIVEPARLTQMLSELRDAGLPGYADPDESP